MDAIYLFIAISCRHSTSRRLLTA